ncbi:MAG: formylglycine-generating enzyme family protein [Pirellulales bacterium]
MNSSSPHDVELVQLNTEIRKLRAEGNPLEGLRKLLGIELNPDQSGQLGAVKKLWDEHFFAGDCLLLEAGNQAVRSWLSGASVDSLLKVIRQFDEAAAALSSKWHSTKWLSQAHARSRLIQALLGDLTPDELSTEFQEILNAYVEVWPHENTDETNRFISSDARPAWLTTPDFPRGFEEKLREFVRSLGTAHPAWHLVADSIAYLFRPARRFDRSSIAETWIMLAESPPAPLQNSQVKDWRPARGLVAKLRIERVDQGCGAIYPHPASAGYLRFDPKFAASVHDALRVVIQLDGLGKVAASDYRWSIEIVGQDAALHRHVRLEGPSGGLAFAVAIRATVLNEDLDAHVACTAQFDRKTLTLAKVGHVLRKAAAQDLSDRQVTEVLVAFGQEVDAVGVIDTSTTPSGWSLTLVPVEDLRSAYERFAKFPRITRAVKSYLRARSQRLLTFLCHPYERPSICRRKERLDREAKSEDDLYEKLDAHELEQLFAGRPSAKRIQLFADSGFGKSTLLVEMEGTIASTAGPLVPVRVGAGFSDVPPGAQEPLHLPLLDDDLFRGSRQQVVENLIQRLDWLNGTDAGDRAVKIQERDLREWLERKLAAGEVVFLFDAADQTSHQPTGVAALLKTCRNCAAVVSGRPETKKTKEQLWGAETWDTLYSRGFDQEEWRRYFSADAAPRERQFTESRAYRIWKNKDWQPVVRPPILAEQVKRLDREGELVDSTSRYRLYTISLEELVAKGLDTLNSTPATRHREEDWTAAEVMDSILAPLAWQMLQVELAHSADGTFRGQVAGRDYGELKASRREELDPITFEVLWQIGITIRMAILDQDGKQPAADARHGQRRLAEKDAAGLSWRHLSFFEYFVGRALAARPDEFAAVAERYARATQWRWIFRFALSRLGELKQVGTLNSLAKCLIQYGNPFVVYEAITRDHVTLDPDLNAFCRWLVHRDRYASEAWQSEDPPTVSQELIEIVSTAMRLEFRDSRYLHAAWELVQKAINDQSADEYVRARASDIRQQFLTEFPRLLAARNPAVVQIDSSFLRCPPTEKRAPEDAVGRPFVQGTAGDTSNEFPHWVVVSPFELMDFPVTNAQFELMAPRHARSEYNLSDEQPVTEVAWYESQMFAIWVGGALPTEAQWEYAARAGSTTKYCRIADMDSDNGYRDLDSEGDLRVVANYGRNVGATTPRGQYKPNWWGLYDMLGNVWEWCEDWYSEEYYRDLSDSTSVDPTGPKRGSLRVDRGGSWYSVSVDCRTAYRDRYDPSYRDSYQGFRIARVLSAKPAQETGKVERAES